MESPDGADPGIINKAILLLEKRIELLLDEWRARATSTWSMNSRDPFSRDLSTLYGCGWPREGAPEQLTISDGLHGYYIIKLEESGPLPASKQHLQHEFALRRQKLQQSFQELPYNLVVHAVNQLLDLEITEFCAAEWEHLVEPDLTDWRYDEEVDSKALAEPVELQPDPLDAIVQQKIKTMSFPQKLRLVAKYRLVQFRACPSLDEFKIIIFSSDPKGILSQRHDWLPMYISPKDFVDILDTRYAPNHLPSNEDVVKLQVVEYHQAEQFSKDRKLVNDTKRAKRVATTLLSKGSSRKPSMTDEWLIHSLCEKIEPGKKQEMLPPRGKPRPVTNESFLEMIQEVKKGRIPILVKLSQQDLFDKWCQIRDIKQSIRDAECADLPWIDSTKVACAVKDWREQDVENGIASPHFDPDIWDSMRMTYPELPRGACRYDPFPSMSREEPPRQPLPPRPTIQAQNRGLVSGPKDEHDESGAALQGNGAVQGNGDDKKGTGAPIDSSSSNITGCAVNTTVNDVARDDAYSESSYDGNLDSLPTIPKSEPDTTDSFF